MPLLAENHMGRPTKIEGNPEHPGEPRRHRRPGARRRSSTLYDPDRSRTVLGPRRSQDVGALPRRPFRRPSTSQHGLRGQGLRLLTEPITSPSLARADRDAAGGAAEAKWHQWDAGLRRRPGRRARRDARSTTSTRPTSSSSLDADFLGFGPAAVRYTKDFSSRRRIGTPQDELNRLYAVEPVPTITGAKADHRLRAQGARRRRRSPARSRPRVGVAGAGSARHAARRRATKWIPAIAADLQRASRQVGRRRRRPSAGGGARARARR